MQLLDLYNNAARLQNILYNHIHDPEIQESVQLCYFLVYFTLHDHSENSTDINKSFVKYIHFVYRVAIFQTHSPYLIAHSYISHNGDIVDLPVQGGRTLVFSVHAIGDAALLFPVELFEPNQSVRDTAEVFIWRSELNSVSKFTKSDQSQHMLVPYSLMAQPKMCPFRANEVSLATIRECATVTLLKKDTLWIEEDRGLYVKDYRFTIDFDDFYFQSLTEVRVCHHAYLEMLNNTMYTVSPQRTMSTEVAVSVACISVSLISLLITILVFTTLPTLQTLPGLNTLALSICLLIAQLLYIVSSFGLMQRHSWMCVGVGILLHFFSLVAIFWMNICTFHMFRVLTATKVISQNYGRKYAVFHMFAILMSLLFVVVCVAVSLQRSGGSDAGYGSVTCYFTSELLQRYTFVLPVFAVVVSNFSMFVFVILKFERSPKYIRSNVRNRNEFIIFIKLSSLTGVTWIFGVLYSWFQVHALSYMFIVLNASQGVFIMVSFVFNGRVLRLGKDRLQHSWLRGNSNSSQTKRTSAGPAISKEKRSPTPEIVQDKAPDINDVINGADEEGVATEDVVVNEVESQGHDKTSNGLETNVTDSELDIEETDLPPPYGQVVT